MAAAGLGQCTNDYTLRRGRRSRGAEAAVAMLLAAGADVNAVNEADFSALHGAAFRGLNEVVGLLVHRGADIDARDFRGRTAYRLAQGSKQSFYFQEYPETAAYLAGLGADTAIGLAGTVQERSRDVAGERITPRRAAGRAARRLTAANRSRSSAVEESAPRGADSRRSARLSCRTGGRTP